MPQLVDSHIFPYILGSTSTEYRYKGFWNCDCVCGLQHGRNHQTDKNFVILTELPQNEGTSVTNFVEHLATQVLRQLGFDPLNTIIIEHYPERGSKFNPLPESWDLVLPDWDNGIAKVPRDHHLWQHLTRQEALKLIGVEPPQEE